MRLARLVALSVGTVLAACLAGVSSAATPSWDVSGTWVGFAGTLTLSQSGATLTGSFQMNGKVGCGMRYTASGTISGSAVSISLKRADGGANAPPCAATQTLIGSVGTSGTSISLSLKNAYQTSPAATFTGKAHAYTGSTTPPPATTIAKPTTTVATPKPVAHTFGADIVCTAATQLCSPAYTTSVKAVGTTLTAQFTTSTAHCSSLRVLIAVDGAGERTSAFLPGGASAPVYTWTVKPGIHTVRVRAEGKTGGCNYGTLKRWGGYLKVVA